MRIPLEETISTMRDILVQKGAPADYAELIATTMATNSLLGVYSHGINRFQRLCSTVDSGAIDPNAVAERIAGLGGYEVWEGNRAFGIVNATRCTNRAIELAKTHGIACVALRNTNHWLRGGTYGGMIADAGMIGICFTNTIANTMAWGSRASILGNNPLAIAVPREGGNVAIDMAMSQFSYGKLEYTQLAGGQLPYEGGFDKEGNATRDPAAILESRLMMPTGMWKGSGLSLLLDLVTSCLSQGKTVLQLSAGGSEQDLCQTFIAINYKAVVSDHITAASIEESIQQLMNSEPLREDAPVRYPGQSALTIREDNLKNGIPVDERVWNGILSIRA